MSLKYRVKRIDNICKSWNLKRPHDLMAYYQLDNRIYNEFKSKVKLYICKALNINYEVRDDIFLKNINSARKNRLNITPNGGVVPKREFQMEYNIVLREWCEIIRGMAKNNLKLITKFRVTPNIRIKFGKELKDNIGRGLSTSLPHSDAWVEGPWGMNCFFPIFGDTLNNNLVYYEPINFSEKMLNISKTYNEMQWVMKNYKIKKSLKPKEGRIYFSDYALIHNTFRNPNCETRVSIDTTLFVGHHKPHKDRLSEYRDKIPNIGIDEFIYVKRFEKEKPEIKKSTFSHYTTGNLKPIKLST